MTQWTNMHQPCPCGDSSDAYAVAKDGHGWCFSCGKGFFENKEDSRVSDPTQNYTYEYLERRGITKETHQFFGVETQINAEGVPVSVAYPHADGWKQIRRIDIPKGKDTFRYVGDVTSGGFCKERFPAGCSSAITITEGYDDAMSVWQMLGKYPVYSVRSASTALSDVRRDYDYLNSFEKIYLALDDDEPGQKAAAQIAPIFGQGKVYRLRLAPFKDPHEFLEQKKVKEFKSVWWNAKRWMPDNVISSFEDIRAAFKKREATVRYDWPWPAWQRATDGIEIHRQYMISGLEGIGKTEILHEIAAHLSATYPDLNLGFVHAEEPVTDTVTIQVAKHLRQPIHLKEFQRPDNEVLDLFESQVAKRQDRIHFYRHFGSEDTDVLTSTIRFLVAACGCQIILFDNYQHLVSGRTSDRDTEALDYLANRLESLVKELPFALISISHENDHELTRGSRLLSKETDVWINVKRNIKHENEFVRNIQHVVINKNRQTGRTGPICMLTYDQTTATLSELTGELPT